MGKKKKKKKKKKKWSTINAIGNANNKFISRP